MAGFVSSKKLYGYLHNTIWYDYSFYGVDIFVFQSGKILNTLFGI